MGKTIGNDFDKKSRVMQMQAQMQMQIQMQMQMQGKINA